MEQPAAPSPLVSPSPQDSQVSAPPTEKVPEGYLVIPVRSSLGLWPAGAVLQALLKASSEYCPGPLHSVHAVASPPIDA